MTTPPLYNTPLSPLRQAIRDLILALVARHPSANWQEFIDSMGRFSERTWHRAVAQQDDPGERSPRLEDLLVVLSAGTNVEVADLVMVLARLLEEAATETAVFEARHRASVMLEAARTSGHNMILINVEDVALLVEGPQTVRELLDHAARLDD